MGRTEMMIIGGTIGDGFAQPVAAAVDPRTGSWRLLPGLNEVAALRPTGAVWSGDEVFVAGSRYLCPEQGSSCTEATPVFLAYDPSSDQIDEIDLTDAPVDEQMASSLAPIGWTGGEIALSTIGDPSTGIVFYDPASGDWRTGAATPCAVGEAGYAQTAWLGDRQVVPCGADRLQIYDRRLDTWAIMEAGPSALNSREGARSCGRART